MIEKWGHIEDNICISLILTFIGGFLDAYTFVLYDKIFANTQTGNLIYLSIYLVEGEFYSAILRLFPILSFCIAIFLAQFLMLKFENKKNYYKIIIAINIIVTMIIGSGLIKNINALVISLVAFVCALTIAVFKKASGDVYAPIMCTGNLRSMMENVSKWVLYRNKDNRNKFFKYISIIIIFCMGVSIGILVIKLTGVYSVFLCTILYMIVLFIMSHIQKNNK